MVHCNTPAIVGAPAKSRTNTERMLSGVHWAPCCWRRRNRARWHDSVTVRNTGAPRGAGGIAHRHRELHSVACKRWLPAATREAAAGTENNEVIHRIAIRIWNEILKKGDGPDCRGTSGNAIQCAESTPAVKRETIARVTNGENGQKKLEKKNINGHWAGPFL